MSCSSSCLLFLSAMCILRFNLRWSRWTVLDRGAAARGALHFLISDQLH